MPRKYREAFFEELREPSRIKLSILEKYLVPWASKLGSIPSSSDIWVVDGFAGPGTYQDSDKTSGSPELILKEARKRIGKRSRLRCVFVEKDTGHWQKLRRLCEEYSDVEPILFQGDFWNQIDNVIGAVAHQPLLLVIDPFGIKGLDYQELVRLANSSEKCDLIVTFISRAVPRLESQYPRDLETATGPGELQNESAPERFSRNICRGASFLAGGRFSVKPPDKPEAYELIVFSRSAHAYEIWNDLMPREIQEQRGRSEGPGQSELLGFPDILEEAEQKDAAKEILDWAKSSSNLSFTRREMTDRFVIDRFTVYHTSTLKKAFRLLEAEGRIECQRKARADTSLWRVTDSTPVL